VEEIEAFNLEFQKKKKRKEKGFLVGEGREKGKCLP
jgi:hypothetical protein